MRDPESFLIILGTILVFPLLFALAYLVWNTNPIAALMLLFIGLSADVLVGLQILDKRLSHS